MQLSDSNINTLIAQRNWDSLYSRFDRMSNSEFRRVQQMVRVQILPHLSADLFWDAYLHLLVYRRQSFLSSIMAIHHLAHAGQLTFDCPEALATSSWLRANSPDSVVKVLRMAVPELASSEQIQACFQWLDFSDSREIASILVHETSAHAYHALFTMLKHDDGNMPLLRSVFVNLLRKGDDMSFNMASILRAYFDIKDINCTLSLQIEPYELSYIDQSADNFMHVLKGKQPKMR